MSRSGLQTGSSRLGTGASIQSMLMTGQPTGVRLQTGMMEEDVLRPMTAVRGAGYTSQPRPGTSMFDPMNQRTHGPVPGFDKREETYVLFFFVSKKINRCANTRN